MLIFGREIARRTIAMIVGALLIVVLASIALSQCDRRRNEAAQGKVGGAQAGAAAESGQDAVNTVAGAGRREADSEALTRANERDIRAADGAGDQVKPGVANAGRAALCRREAYRDRAECKGVKP